MTLYDYQEPLMDPMLKILNDPDKRLAVMALSVGTGKTVVALELMRRGNFSFGVLAPKTTLGQWRRTAELIGVSPRFVLNPEAVRGGSRPDIVVRNSPVSFGWKALGENDVLVLDEIHRFGAPDSQLAYMAAHASASKIRILGLSATLADSPLKMRLLLHAARLVPWKGFYPWAQSVHCYRDTRINGHPWRPPYGATCRKVMADLNAKFFPDFGVRLRSEDVPNFPEVQNIVDLVTPSEEVRKNIDAAYSSMADILKYPERAKTELTQLLRLRQRVEMERIHCFKELVDDALEDGYSVVVSFNFTASLFAFKRMFAKIDPAMIYGSDENGRQQTDSERDFEKGRFQRNDARLLLLTIQAGGVGLSLGDELGDHPRIAFHSLPIDTVSLVQLLGRIHRADSKTKSVNRIILVDGVAVEKKVFGILNRKIGNLSALQGDDLDLSRLMSN